MVNLLVRLRSFESAALLLLFLLIPASRLHAQISPTARPATPQFRPAWHFSPARNFMNDPNGTVYAGGHYHLFFQYNPFGDVWGHMSWGHAVSRDLVHWRQLPVALREADGVMIFSGSAVVDAHNSSGLCTAPSHSCLIAIYAGHSDTAETQNIAYSNDGGRTWTKYAHNPVIDIHSKNFRDPKVIWDRQRRQWVMVTVLADQHKVRFYGSKDLLHWRQLSDFGPAGATGGAWECPLLFSLPVDGDARRTKWVLAVGINPGGLTGGSGVQYFIGNFDGTHFTDDNPPAQTLWADWGADFYALASWDNDPQGRMIWIAWMSSWLYANQVPTSPWRGQDSAPRTLTLKTFPQGIRLVQTPVAEIASLRGPAIHVRPLTIPSGADLDLTPRGVAGDVLEIDTVLNPGSARDFGVKLRTGQGEETLVGYDVERQQVYVDRSHSGLSTFSPKFASRQTAPLALRGQPLRLHILMDRCSVEVFADQGETVLTDLIFPRASSRGVKLYSHGGNARLRHLTAWKLTAKP